MFYLRLALALGKTLGQLLSEVDSQELSLWEAYYCVEPFGQDRNDVAVAIQSALMANLWGSGSHRFAPSEFMPIFDERNREHDWYRMRESFLNFKNATDRRRHGS